MFTIEYKLDSDFGKERFWVYMDWSYMEGNEEGIVLYFDIPVNNPNANREQLWEEFNAFLRREKVEWLIKDDEDYILDFDNLLNDIRTGDRYEKRCTNFPDVEWFNGKLEVPIRQGGVSVNSGSGDPNDLYCTYDLTLLKAQIEKRKRDIEEIKKLQAPKIIFLSCAHEDRKRIDEFQKTLEVIGYDCWFYENDSIVGKPCSEEYLAKIKNSRVVVYFITESFTEKIKNTGSGVYKELFAGVERYQSENEKFKIIPIIMPPLRVIYKILRKLGVRKIKIPSIIKETDITYSEGKSELECLRIILKSIQDLELNEATDYLGAFSFE